MFTDPVKNLKALALREDDVVADLGAGTGFYSIALAHLVPNGRVYAVELHKDYLETIKNKARDAHVKNIEVIWGNTEKVGGTKIGDHIVNAVVVSNVLSQLEDKHKFADEVSRILKPGGKVLVVDWSEATPAVHPKFLVKPSDAKALFEKKGIFLERDINAGAHHYGMILIKKDA